MMSPNAQPDSPKASSPEPKSAVAAVSPADLEAFEVFQDLPQDLLQWLCTSGETLETTDGEIIGAEGSAADHMMVVVRGSLQVTLNVGGQHLLLAGQEPGEVTGLLPYSRMTHFQGTVRSVGESTFLRLHRQHFPELVARSYELSRRLVERLSTRVRESTRTEQQREKMVALGQLSAGLAHELNNPAAAIARAADDLRRRLDEGSQRLPAVARRPHAATIAEAAAHLRQKAQQRLAEEGGTKVLGDLERSEREDELADWLDEHEVEESWVLAESLVEAGVEAPQLDELLNACPDFPDDGLVDLVPWLSTSLAADQLLTDIGSAAQRISTLVASVKAYSHMDRSSDRQPTDIVQGMESTLTMLGHKLRTKNLQIQRQFAPDLPLVPAHPGELNQVWTNLIDNAVDALEDGGTITVGAVANDEMVKVTIEDNGSGVPEDIQRRVFEPFFTTKPMGEGSGLGLDIVQRIVDQHQGQLRLDSVPGRTVFTVCVPLAVPGA
ncbi:MAG: ATP-binding protein [Acidobacteriota bacterium]